MTVYSPVHGGRALCFNQVKPVEDQENEKVNGSKYPIVELEDGRKAYKLSNGTLKDVETGYFLTPPDDEHAPITQANASALAKKRWEAYRERAEVGVVDGANAAGVFVETTLEGWQWIVSRQTELAGNIRKGRDSTNAAKFVAQALDAVPDRRQRPVETPEQGAALLMSSDLAMKLARLLRGGDSG